MIRLVHARYTERIGKPVRTRLKELARIKEEDKNEFTGRKFRT